MQGQSAQTPGPTRLTLAAWRDSIAAAFVHTTPAYRWTPPSAAHPFVPPQCEAGIRPIDSVHALVADGERRALCLAWWRPNHPFADRDAPSLLARRGYPAGRLDSIARVFGALTSTLERAVSEHPTDEWIVGQWVRHLFDIGLPASALRASRECVASRWWCLVLEGYAQMRHQRVPEADSVFLEAMRRAPPAVRCEWESIGELLVEAERAQYSALDCAGRDALNARFWWLASPLLAERGHERRADHYSRIMWTALGSALDVDHRIEWRPATGGDLFRIVLLRYGLPGSHAVFPPPGWRRTMSAWVSRRPLHEINPALRPASAMPAQTLVFDRDAVALAPSLELVNDPWSGGRDAHRVRTGRTATGGWEIEHFVPRRGLVQLPSAQHGFLRRAEYTEVLVAAQLPPQLLRRAEGETVPSSLVASSSPDSIVVLARFDATAGSVAVARARIPAQRALLGLELTSDSTHPAARVRFAVEPPASLAEVQPDELAISSLFLLEDDSLAPGGGPVEDALLMMRGSHQRSGARRLGLYWESYGLATSDSVAMTLWIERVTPQGRWREIGVAMRIATDRNTPVAVHWTETAAPPNALVIPGAVPVIGRVVSVDVSTLERGEYRLSLAMARPGQTPVLAHTSLVVE